MCGGRSSILHYGPLMETNYLYAPTPNGQSPSASINKNNTPSLRSAQHMKISLASLSPQTSFKNE